jgi:membrane-associated phospholipid phosphatase
MVATGKASRLLGGAMLGAASAAIGYAALNTREGPAVDGELFDLVNGGHGPAADRYFTGVTELGSLYASAAAAAALALTGHRREASRALAAAGATWLLLQGVKKLVDRPRPYEPGGHDPDRARLLVAPMRGTSWPSSHPAVLTTFTRVASRELGLGWVSRRALGALDLSVAASRVYVGVHYPSDVGSGLLIGRAVAKVWPRRS